MLTKKQLQSELNVSNTTVFNWILSGRIPPPDDYGPLGSLWNDGIVDRVKGSMEFSAIDKGLLKFLGNDSTAAQIATALNVTKSNVYYSCKLHSVSIYSKYSARTKKAVNKVIDKDLLESLAKDNTAAQIALALNVTRYNVYYSCKAHLIAPVKEKPGRKPKGAHHASKYMTSRM